MIDALRQDVSYGLRMLRKNPGFSAVAVATLALGIGAASAVFSVVKGILLQPLPFKDPSRLVAVLDSKRSQSVQWLFVPPARYEEWVRRNTVFEQITAAQNCYYKIDVGGVPTLLQGGCVSADFFPMLGVRPKIGRLFSADEDQPGGDPVAVLSYGCWQNHFGGDPGVLGRTIRRTANDAAFTIIGVLPSEFKFATEDFALWAPLKTDPNYYHLDERNMLVFARLKDGVTVAQAQAAMDAVAEQMEREFPATSAGWGITVQSLQGFYSSIRNIRQTLWILFASVGCLLLIACSNIANLLLARATARRGEITIRLALGATRRRLAGQLITESAMLGVLGGAAGFLLARTCFATLLSITPYIPSFRPNAIRMDNQVFGFAMATSMVAVLIFALMPALRASRQDLTASLRESGRGASGGMADRLMRNVLVISQMALAVVLLAGSGLLIKSFRNLQSDQLGINSSHILMAGVCCLDEAHYTAQRDFSAFYGQLFDRLRAMPGVESVSGASDLPLRHPQSPGDAFEVQGLSVSQPGTEPTGDFIFIDPQYFETMQVPMLRGRPLTDADGENAAPVAVVNETLARQIWPGEDPIGRAIRPVTGETTGRWYRIVGVAADTRERGLGTEPRPTIYRSYYQNLARYTYVLIRTQPDPASMIEDVKKTIASVSRGLPANDVRVLDREVAASISTQRFSMLLVTLFAVLALSLAAVGVYGVTAYRVAQRTHEVGVRMALGAAPRSVAKMLLMEGLRLASVGLTAGLLASVAVTRFLAAILYRGKVVDPLILTITIALLLSVVIVATIVPALRAMKVDPAVALRCE